MKNKIKRIGGILSAALLAVNINIFAEESSVRFYETISEEYGYGLIVEGYTLSRKADKNINIIILNPNNTLGGEPAAEGDFVLQYQDDTMTGADGYFKFEFPIFLDDINDTGDYICYLGGDDYDRAVKLEEAVFFASTQAKKAAIENIVKSTDLLKTLEGTDQEDGAAKLLGIQNDIYHAVSKADYAKLIGIRQTEDADYLDQDDIIASVLKLKKLLLIEVYNEGLTKFIANDQNQFINTDLIDFSTADAGGGNAYGTIFEKIIAEDAKKEFIDSLCKKNVTSEEALKALFVGNAMVYGIQRAKTEGVGHISEILTEANAKSAGINISSYLALGGNDRNSAASELMKKTIPDAQSLERELRTIVENINQQKSTSGGNKTGGTSGTKQTGIVSIPQEEFSQPVTSIEKSGFEDMEGYEWALEAVNYLCEKGVVHGVSAERFEPDGLLTREQAAKLIALGFGCQQSRTEPVFDDVLENQWYTEYVMALYQSGISSGMTERRFGVGESMTRQDFAAIIYRALGNTAQIEPGEEFADQDNISDYAVDAVNYLSGTGLINGFEDGTFRPKAQITRAQAAKIIYDAIRG